MKKIAPVSNDYKRVIKRMFALPAAVLILSGMAVSCAAFDKTAREELTQGYYIRSSKDGRKKVFVRITEQDVRIYPATKNGRNLTVDPARFESIPPESKTIGDGEFMLDRKSFDFDVMTIPVKFRPSQKHVPAQLNANLNGAGFLGIRTDRYKISYKHDPLGVSGRAIDHFGYSVGLFTGIGNTFMSATNTNGAISQEYDGIVWNKGVAAIFAINSFTAGLAIGTDNLLDRNNRLWIYENRPWAGITVGLNLN